MKHYDPVDALDVFEEIKKSADEKISDEVAARLTEGVLVADAIALYTSSYSLGELDKGFGILSGAIGEVASAMWDVADEIADAN